MGPNISGSRRVKTQFWYGCSSFVNYARLNDIKWAKRTINALITNINDNYIRID